MSYTQIWIFTAYYISFLLNWFSIPIPFQMSGFKESNVWMQVNSAQAPMGRKHQVWPFLQIEKK